MRYFVIGTFLTIIGVGVPAIGQEPTGAEVVQRSAKMAGGKAAFAGVKSVVMKGTFSIPKAKVTGSVLTQYAAPDRAKITIDLGQLGTTLQGIHGNIGWESSPNTGDRLLSQKETSLLLESISMRNAFETAKVYASIENKGREEVDGEACHRLELKRPNSDGVDQVFYSVASGLPIKTITSRVTPAGATVINSRVSDYKEYKGIKLATKIVQHIEAFDVTYEIQIESVEINSQLDEALFQVPESIKRLLK